MNLVTGATGHAGNVIVRELLARDRRVKVFVRPTSDINPLKEFKVEVATGDILNLDSLIVAFKNADIVYHLAGDVSIMPGNEKYMHEINVVGTQNVIKACIECKVKRLVYMSSIHAIKEPPNGIVIDESLPFDPDSLISEYQRSKARASLEVLKAVDSGLDSVVVCPTGFMGPYDYKISIIGKTIIEFAEKKLKFLIDGAYDFVDVRDVAVGSILACDKGKTGESYILSGERVTIGELMLMLEDITGIKAPHYKVPIWLAKFVATFSQLYCRLTKAEPYFTRYSVYTLLSNSNISHKKASRDLGYLPRPIKSSVADSIQWFKDRGIL
jgi:dihydroflavonol-4-reductase